MMRVELGIIDQRSIRLTDGWTDGWMEGRTDRRMCRQSDNYDYVDRGGSEMENAMVMIWM